MPFGIPPLAAKLAHAIAEMAALNEAAPTRLDDESSVCTASTPLQHALPNASILRCLLSCPAAQVPTPRALQPAGCAAPSSLWPFGKWQYYLRQRCWCGARTATPPQLSRGSQVRTTAPSEPTTNLALDGNNGLFCRGVASRCRFLVLCVC
mmetsp:Transcript_78685/g.218532  ORF Transcript_78685/g.218532 Transcript_78685/m.218532 type:complete len:151 (-) Transcript_78685:832-1284(-)